MLILFYIALAVALIYLFIYLFRKNFSAKRLRAELKADWGKPKNSRYMDLDSIENYFLNTIADSTDKLQLISDSIADDLYLDELFKLVDRTISKVGQQYLYARLRTIDKDTGNIAFLDQLAEKMGTDEQLRLDTQATLSLLQKNDSYYFQDLIYARKAARPGFMPLVYLLSFLNAGLLVAAIWHPGFLLVFMGVFLVNSGIHFWNKNNVSVHTSALGEFLKVFETGKKLQTVPEIAQFFPESGAMLRLLSPLKRKMTGVKIDTVADNDAAMFGFLLYELIKIAFNIEIISFYAIINLLNQQKKELKTLFAFVGQIDTAISIASLRASLPEYCKPIFSTDGTFRVEGVKNPLIANCVPNNLNLGEKNLLLTGSNMSGKTTFIRTVGMNMILGQTLFTCTASAFHMPYSRIYSSINIADSLLEDKSYYFEEMQTIKAFIRESRNGSPCFFILDELFKGTNTIERVAAGKAILSYLAGNGNLVFVSTHDTELNALLEGTYDLYHFTETVEQEALLFDHTIKKGPLKTRNAIRILQMNDYPAEVVREANATVDLLTGISH